MIDALQGYDASKGEFSTYLRYHCRRRFNEVAGISTTKRDAAIVATSLDIPLTDSTDTTRLDALPDLTAHHAYDDIVEHEAARQDYTALMTEIDKLPAEQRQALVLIGRDGLSVKAAAEQMNISPERVRQCRDKAAVNIRRTKTGRIVGRDYYRHVTLSRFKVTHTSSVEEFVLWREQMEEKHRNAEAAQEVAVIEQIWQP